MIVWVGPEAIAVSCSADTVVIWALPDAVTVSAGAVTVSGGDDISCVNTIVEAALSMVCTSICSGMLSVTVTGGIIDVQVCLSVVPSIVIVDVGAKIVTGTVERRTVSTREVATEPEAVTVWLCYSLHVRFIIFCFCREHDFLTVTVRGF